MRELSEFAKQFLSRATSHVTRWHHRHAAWKESLAEHHALTGRMAYEVGCLLIDLGICTTSEVIPEKVLVAGVYHDEHETVTGDIPTSAKRLIPGMREVIERWDRTATQMLWGDYPEQLQERLRRIVRQSALTEVEKQVVHYSDALSAYSYARDQVLMGNEYFKHIVEFTESEEYLAGLDYPWLSELREAAGLP